METEERSVLDDEVAAGEQNEDRSDVSKLEAAEEALSSVQRSEELHPESYRTNSPKEEQLLKMADNFQRQYLLLHPDRKPLLLCPVNECGVRKFVSTTLRPTGTGLWELQSWQDCSSFVADFLSLQPLEPPTVVPSQLFSPTSVLRSQKATCFESSTLLCSLLLGLNYDAYCVSGYASREMCLSDQSLQQCPLLEAEVESVQNKPAEQEPQEKKYGVKRDVELSSRFLKEQEKKKQEAEAVLLREQELQEETSRRVPDPLRGFRVHSWVLVLSGSRSIKENFFIDPLTGWSFPTTDDDFHGIESLWNNFNYYVNRQECINGCRDLLFDLEDQSRWEPVLLDGISQQQLSRVVQKRRERRIIGKISADLEESLPRKFLLLRSWVSSIVVSEEDLQTRFPGGKKVIRFRKAKLERFSASVSKDAVISRLTTYKDLDCTEVTGVKEWFKNRSDGLEERDFNKVENVTTERFKPRRAFNLLFHKWKVVTSGTEREMRFSSFAEDGLERRVVTLQTMEESFKDRDDFLCFRHVLFSQGVQTSLLCLLKITLENQHVLKVVERFNRNTSKPANKDVAQRVFLVPQMQVDQREKPPGPLSWYRMLRDLVNEKEMVARQIQASLTQMENILECREQEENAVTVFSSELDHALAYRYKLIEEDTMKKELSLFHQYEAEIVIPFLQQITNSLDPEESSSLCLSFLDNYKQKLEDHTRVLENNLEKVIESQKLKDINNNHNHDLTMNPELAEPFCHLCWERQLCISVAQRSLDRHKKNLEMRCKAFLRKLQQSHQIP